MKSSASRTRRWNTKTVDLDGVNRGIIRFLGYTPGERAAGQELLSCAEERLRAFGVRQIVAFKEDFSYPFYHLALGYLSERLAHITGLLGVNGYGINPEGLGARGEIFFAWPDYDVARPDKPDEKLTIGVEPTEGDGRLPNVRFDMRLKGNLDRMGLCETYCVCHWTRAQDAQETFRVSWLSIHGNFQSRGWGRFLLLSALHELKRMGYRRATVSTNVMNYRAMTFYGNLGFHVVDTAYEFTKWLA